VVKYVSFLLRKIQVEKLPATPPALNTNFHEKAHHIAARNSSPPLGIADGYISANRRFDRKSWSQIQTNGNREIAKLTKKKTRQSAHLLNYRNQRSYNPIKTTPFQESSRHLRLRSSISSDPIFPKKNASAPATNG